MRAFGLLFWGMIVALLASTVGLYAAERELTITDYSMRGFAPDLVSYDVDIDPAKAKNLRLFGPDGKPVPMQLTQVWKQRSKPQVSVQFVAEVPHDETISYRLRDDGKGNVPAGKVNVKSSPKEIVISNEFMAVRLPGLQDKEFKTPVKASTLPAPILAFKSGNSAWLGEGKILSERLVKRLNVVITKGPVFVRAEYAISWADGGDYWCVVTVIDGVPVAKVFERFDLGKLDGSDMWELNLSKGWTPKTAEKARPWGNGTNVDSGRLIPITSLPKDKKILFNHLGLYQEDPSQAAKEGPMAGVAVLNRGSWRRWMDIDNEFKDGKTLYFRFAMSVRDACWTKDLTSRRSPFSMQSYDNKMSPTEGIRLWGLVLGRPQLKKAESAVYSYSAPWSAPKSFSNLPPISQAVSLYGVVGLNRYKDYILDWPEGNVERPLLSPKGEDAQAMSRALETLPLPERYRKDFAAHYATIIQGDAAKAGKDIALLKRHKNFLGGLMWIPAYCLNCPFISHHPTCTNYAYAYLADDLLARKDLPAEARKEIRARMALCTYLLEEPDVQYFGNGLHPGNPNMGTARFMSLNAFVAALPDHPMYEQWRKHVTEYTNYNLSSQMAPGGGWFEYGGYHFHGTDRALNVLPALKVMKSETVAQDYDYIKQTMTYAMKILTPYDSRHRARMLPGLANSEPLMVPTFLQTAGIFEKDDPAFAAKMLWAWEENGKGTADILPLLPTTTKAKKVELGSEAIPGIGVVFRAHQGPDETYMLLRSGFLWSHWYIDPGHFTMMSRGATLVPYQPYQYYTTPNKEFDMYNTIRFGAPANQWPYGWPDHSILEHAFGKSVDYAWCTTGFPDWYISPGTSEEFRKSKDVAIPISADRPLVKDYKQKQGAFTWDRQVMFLKGKTAASPNYFVFRDSVHGEGEMASYLNLNLLGREKDVTVNKNRLQVKTEWPVGMDVVFANHASVSPAFLEENHKHQMHGTGTKERYTKDEKVSPNWLDAKGKPAENMAKVVSEQHVILRIPAAPQKGYFWVLYPRKADEAAPQCKVLADGVMQITHPEGTDTVFLSPRPIEYAAGDIKFAGTSGAVRVGKDNTVTLAVTGGSGVVTHKGRTLSGSAPLEKRLAAGQTTGGKTYMAATGINMPETPATATKVADTLQKVVEDGNTRYWVRQAPSTIVTDGDARFTAESAYIEAKGGSVRFVVPEANYAELCVGNVGVRGVGPFDLTLTPEKISGTVEGRTRSIITTWPEKIVRPMFHMDGRRWYAGWSDDPSIGQGQKTPQFAFCFGVLDGKHEIAVEEWTYPAMPPEPTPRRVSF